MRTVMIQFVILTALIIHARGELAVDPEPEPSGFNLNGVVVHNNEEGPSIKIVPRKSEDTHPKVDDVNGHGLELPFDILASNPEKRSLSELEGPLDQVNLTSIHEKRSLLSELQVSQVSLDAVNLTVDQSVDKRSPSLELQLPLDFSNLTSTQEKRNAPKVDPKAEHPSGVQHNGKDSSSKGVVIDSTAHHAPTSPKPTKAKPTTPHATTTPKGISGRSLHPPPATEQGPKGRNLVAHDGSTTGKVVALQEGNNSSTSPHHNGTGADAEEELIALPLQGSLWTQVKTAANALNVTHCPGMDEFYAGSADIKGELKKADSVKEDVSAVVDAAARSFHSMNTCMHRLLTDLKIAVDITKKRRKERKLSVKAVQVSKKKVKIDLTLP